MTQTLIFSNMADLLALSSSCPCCSQPVVIAVSLLVPCIVFYTLEFSLRSTAPRSSGAKMLLSVLKILSRSSSLLIGVLAVLLGVASRSPDLKNKIFFHLLRTMSKYPDEPMDSMHRCRDIKHLSGRVLEIGPGLGANFRCWNESSGHNITEWVGVEPNPLFHGSLQEAVQQFGIRFPTTIVGLKGEVVDVEPESFDYVIGSHVLCSVDNVQTVRRFVSFLIVSILFTYICAYTVMQSSIEMVIF